MTPDIITIIMLIISAITIIVPLILLIYMTLFGSRPKKVEPKLTNLIWEVRTTNDFFGHLKYYGYIYSIVGCKRKKIFVTEEFRKEEDAIEYTKKIYDILKKDLLNEN